MINIDTLAADEKGGMSILLPYFDHFLKELLNFYDICNYFY